MDIFIIFHEDASQVGGKEVYAVFNDQSKASFELGCLADKLEDERQTKVGWLEDDTRFDLDDYSAWIENYTIEED